MKLTYRLQASDFLDYYLYTTFKSESIKKKRRNSVLFFTLIPVGFALYFLYQENSNVMLYFGALALIAGLFYPKYFDWRYKKHFQYFIKDNLSDRINQPTELEIDKKSIFSKDVAGEGKIKLKEVDEITETDKHFFFQISSGMSLIIPKSELENEDAFKSELESLGLSITTDL